jgi:NAD+ diphosphatase
MTRLAFVSSPLDRNANNRTNADFIAKRRNDSTTHVVQIAGDTARVENARLFTLNDTPEIDAIYLGEDPKGCSWFAREIEPNEALIPIRSLMVEGGLTQERLSILAQARSILHWHSSHGFCAKCGAQSLMADAGYKRVCPSCKAEHFPRTDPVVIMAVCHGSQVLLGRQASWPPNMFSALAGFMEPGETIEQAVAREVLEEAGIHIGAVSYVTSQPWPFPSSLMVGMIAEAASTDIVIDPAELETACWFERDELQLMLAGTHPEGLYASRPQAIAHAVVTAALNRMTPTGHGPK